MSTNSVLNEYAHNMVVGISTSFEITHEPTWRETGAKFIHDIWLVKEGTIYVEQGGEVITLEPGDIFMHQPTKLYTAWTGEEGCRFIYTNFDIKLWGENIDTGDLDMYGKFSGDSIKGVFDMYVKTHELYKDSQFMSGLMMKAVLEYMVGKIMYISEARGPVQMQHVKDKGSRIEAVLKYISENSSERLTVKQIAENIGMSEKYFISFFRKAIGQSPYSYITGTKMQAAYNHLATGKYHVYEVADMMGYTDIYTFSKAFKKYYGKSPSKVFNELQ